MLVAEFKRLGSQIVFADFNRIILHTKKNAVLDGIGIYFFKTFLLLKNIYILFIEMLIVVVVAQRRKRVTVSQQL